MAENKRSRTMMHARGVKLRKKSQERWGPGRAIIKHLASRRLRQVPAGESSAGVSIGY
jgi:hypothetical protein